MYNENIQKIANAFLALEMGEFETALRDFLSGLRDKTPEERATALYEFAEDIVQNMQGAPIPQNLNVGALIAQKLTVIERIARMVPPPPKNDDDTKVQNIEGRDNLYGLWLGYLEELLFFRPDHTLLVTTKTAEIAAMPGLDKDIAIRAAGLWGDAAMQHAEIHPDLVLNMAKGALIRNRTAESPMAKIAQIVIDNVNARLAAMPPEARPSPQF